MASARVQVVRFEVLLSEPIFRLCEADGSLCIRWLPDENSDGPLDFGGFESRHDAEAFRLGVDLIRAEAGLLTEMAADIQRERTMLDRGLSFRGRLPSAFGCAA